MHVCVIGIGRTRSSSILYIETPDDIDLSWTFCIFKVLTGWDEKLQHKQPNSPHPSLIYTVANSYSFTTPQSKRSATKLNLFLLNLCPNLC